MKNIVCSLQFVALVILALTFATTARAQVPETQFSTGGAGRVQEQLEETGKAPQPAAPAIEKEPAEMPGIPAGAEKVQFTLTDLFFEGVTVYPDAELKKIYGGKIGQTVSLADVYNIARELTARYRKDGYILSRVVVPPQTIQNGICILHAFEGFIDTVAVEGDRLDNDRTTAQIRGYFNNVLRKAPLNIKDLERSMLLAKDLPGVEARGVFSASKTALGGSDFKVVVKRKHHDAKVTADNFGTRYLGPVQVGAAVSANSWVFRNNERLTLQAVYAPSAPPGEMRHFSATYLQPLFSKGMTLALTARETLTAPGYDLAQYDVRGTSKYAGGTVEYPFLRSREKNFRGHAVFDYQDTSSVNNTTAPRTDRLTSARVGGQYDFIDNTLGRKAFNVMEIEASKGLDLLGASNKGNTNMSRPNAVPTYTKIAAEVQRLQNLAENFNLLLAAKGQASRHSLPGNEEIGIGGGSYGSYGRGYDSSEITGDSGYAGKLELQWNHEANQRLLRNYQLYGFLDGGRVLNKNPTSSNDKSNSLISSGLGTRLNFSNTAAGGLAVAFPLTREVETRGSKSPSVYINLSKKF